MQIIPVQQHIFAGVVIHEGQFPGAIIEHRALCITASCTVMDYHGAPSPVTGIDDSEIIKILEDTARCFAERGDYNMAKNIRDYLQKRDSYIKEHGGKYALVSKEGINITDKTTLHKADIGFSSGPGGLMVKIGQEVEPKQGEHAMYSSSLRYCYKGVHNTRILR